MSYLAHSVNFFNLAYKWRTLKYNGFLYFMNIIMYIKRKVCCKKEGNPTNLKKKSYQKAQEKIEKHFQNFPRKFQSKSKILIKPKRSMTIKLISGEMSQHLLPTFFPIHPRFIRMWKFRQNQFEQHKKKTLKPNRVNKFIERKHFPGDVRNDIKISISIREENQLGIIKSKKNLHQNLIITEIELIK